MLCYGSTSNNLKQLIYYSKAITFTVFKKPTAVLVCIKMLCFQAGWLTVGENQLFELKTKLRVVLLWVNITEIDESGVVLCAKTFLSAFVTCLDFFFPHLQISIVCVHSELCRSYQSVVVAHYKETYASWLWPFQNLTQKATLWARQENDPTKNIQIPKLLTVRECWHC